MSKPLAERTITRQEIAEHGPGITRDFARSIDDEMKKRGFGPFDYDLVMEPDLTGDTYRLTARRRLTTLPEGAYRAIQRGLV